MMEIAKGISNGAYKKLDLSVHTHPDWDTAFRYFHARINDRFLEPVEVLRDAEKNLPPRAKKFGFAILAIDCLLCETLQCFYEGRISSEEKSNIQSPGSSNVFCRFLMERQTFKPYFPTKPLARNFYEDFRCGIFHQAQTTGRTKIISVGALVERSTEYVRVNRELFHDGIKVEVKTYVDLLKQRDKTLLANFKKKMDFIAQ
jgi:hypothetical protein